MRKLAISTISHRLRRSSGPLGSNSVLDTLSIEFFQSANISTLGIPLSVQYSIASNSCYFGSYSW